MTSDHSFPLENATWPAFMVDDSGVIRRANHAAVGVFGGPMESKSASFSAIWSPDNETSAEIFLARWERSGGAGVSLKLLNKEGKSTLYSVHICSIHKDESRVSVFQVFPAGGDKSPTPQPPPPVESKGAAVEASLQQKQKLDCALQLTRTVALDFNNALTSILGHTSLVLSRMEGGHPWRRSLVEVEKSAARAAEIAHDLATFSLQEKESPAQVAGNVNELLRRTVDLFRAQSAGQIEWKTQLEHRLFSANFDEAKLQQAWVKILDNAVQAIEGEGRVTVSTRNQEVLEPLHDETAHLAPGQYVCVEFSDSGPGIPLDVLPRIFEPFFTTKKAPQHRGLGLAWVYGIITNHGGSVAVSSPPGEGASVRVYLPAQKKFIEDRSLKDSDLRGTETVLMIDDEDLLLTMGEAILSSYGYRVLTANSGAKGLEIFAKAQDEIDLVITDLVMPRMSGREVIEHLRRLTPDVKILRSSGYVRALAADADESYLQKPFTSQELLRKVRQVLSSSQ